MVVSHGESNLSQSATDTPLSSTDWFNIDSQFKDISLPIRLSLNSDELDIIEASELFSFALYQHLETSNVVKPKQQGMCFTGLHKERAIEKLTHRLAELKNRARKFFKKVPTTFLNGVRTHNKAVKAKRQQLLQRSTKWQKRAFKSNPWLFAKSICSSPNPPITPQFPKESCRNYFQSILSNNHEFYSGLPDWVSDVMPPPDPEIDFDLSHITPGLIKSTLKKCLSKSSLGADRITYHHLKKLPSTHLFLANLFSKILSSSNKCPPFWCSAKSILIHKKGDPNLPSNFHPIALTSCVGLLFHKIIANRLQSFLIDNGIIDTSCQKGFISGFNGVMKHILTLNA